MNNDFIVKHQHTKTLKIKRGHHVAHFSTPNFVYWCLWWCSNTFCNVMRFNYGKVYINDNIEIILKQVNEHILDQWTHTPDHIDDAYWTYDISSLTDIGVTRSLTDRPKIFDYFVNSPDAKATASIKYIHPEMFGYRAESKIRLRIVLMPDSISNSIEPETLTMQQRLEDAIRLRKKGFEIDFSFAPLVIQSWILEERKSLFGLIDSIIPPQMKDSCKYDAHFLNHHRRQHARNKRHWYKQSEKILWKWLDHTNKRKRIRSYTKSQKQAFAKEFTILHESLLPWNVCRSFKK